MTTFQWAFIVFVTLVLILLLIFRFSRKNRDISATEDDDAKRFARLLVAEIKLYETYKVERGLKTNDLLGSLDNEIKTARTKFSCRFSSPEIFDEALVFVLADGDPAKLGPNFKRTAPEPINEA